MLDIALQTCRALAYAHAKGIVHRDLKPSNILITKDTLTVKVADFGLVQLAQAAGELSTLTQSHIAMGTIEYMAPEQRRDARTVDARADIFSMGIILYEMFTGQLPVGHFKRPGEINQEIPRDLDEVILKCLKPSPEDRYQSAGQLAQELTKILREDSGVLDTIVRKVRTAQQRASTAIRNKPRRTMVAGGAVLALAALFVLMRSCGGERGATVPPPASTPILAAAVITEPGPPPATTTPHPPTSTPTVPPTATRKPEKPTAKPAKPVPTRQPEPAPSSPAEADYRKAESYAAADMTSPSLRQFAVMSLRAVVENYKTTAPQWAEKAQMKLGQIYEKAGQINLALSEYARLLQLFPAGSLRADAQFRIAECVKPTGFMSTLDFSRKEKRGKAVEEYRKVYKEYPSNPLAPKALFAMGLLQEEGGTAEEFEDAIGSFETIAREYPNSDEAPYAMLKVAQICTNKKVHNYEKSIETYEQILKRYPNREEEFHILLNIAAVKEEKLQDMDAAMEGYRRVIREKPGTSDALEANRRIDRLLQASKPAK
jgi:TolA-binding protein